MCRFNQALDCYETAKCGKCGFNPEINSIRVNKIRNGCLIIEPSTAKVRELNQTFTNGRRLGRNEAFLEIVYILAARFEYDPGAILLLREEMKRLQTDISSGKINYAVLQDRLLNYGYVTMEDCE